ncbi:hypothetical protein G6048_01545 [Streptomyces sp. YC419]|uniref:Aspartate/ornithine carbamoyltransferase Asp/Orn-binding domain-containing protein n=1 Tax=Streptomyces ureilyticus TaxID=1775131 RepID=A0ABX0DMH1_9ACTN|nr:hypothetical protein [Streptomyces ureilyticus]
MSAAPSPSYRMPEPVPKVLLPAPRDHRTRLDQELLDTHGLDGPEVTNEVLPPPTYTVFDQAENRLHTIKAVLVATLED